MERVNTLINHIINGTLEGYNHPGGGLSKHGITLIVLKRVRDDYSLTRDDLDKLTEDEARAIYEKIFIHDPGFNGIRDERIKCFCVESGITHGPNRAVTWLQRVVGAKIDGKIGRATLEKINKIGPDIVFMRLVALRIRFYGMIISDNYENYVFASDWLGRVADFLDDGVGY